MKLVVCLFQLEMVQPIFVLCSYSAGSLFFRPKGTHKKLWASIFLPTFFLLENRIFLWVWYNEVGVVIYWILISYQLPIVLPTALFLFVIIFLLLI